ncbi:MAG: malto-oligosyltrehalose trehalohydrolase [Pirellula sp.]|nr:malto-oligosyltrehalose trehalohydrolase [Pirellula sp.]
MILPQPNTVKPSNVQRRRYAVGAETTTDGATSFRVWAPRRKRVDVGILPPAEEAGVPDRNARSYAGPVRVSECSDALRLVELAPDGDGYFTAMVADVATGHRYGFRLDNGERLYADPASRFQPDGPAGLSQVVDPATFAWTDDAWRGPPDDNRVIYEMHLGTFTQEGTWAAAAEHLSRLRELGITILEIMPVADFPGNFGWGYDGVMLFAPTRLYGNPDDFRAFVDRAHAEGLGVILDVVYNHFGNFDNYLSEFSHNYYTDRYKNEWAAALNFEGPAAVPVRELFITNARYWIEEYHLDGYRYDATQCVYDQSNPYILGEATDAARAAAGSRRTYFIGENEPQDVLLLRTSDQKGSGLDALWNDDFHHSAMVRMTGKNPAYYSDYLGSVDELACCARHGFLYQGQRSQWQGKPRGTPTTGLPATAFVTFLQNHDQVANSGAGLRAHALTSPGRYRAMTALWLLSPQTPLFFQGQEFGADSPFLFFADFSGDAAEAVAEGRRSFLAQFPALRMPEEQRLLPNPASRDTFERCRLNHDEREQNQTLWNLHLDLLALRRDDPVFSRHRADLIHTTTLGPDAFLLRYKAAPDAPADSPAAEERLILVNFGTELLICPSPQPLLAPPAGCGWQLLWSSDNPRYGADYSPPLETTSGWRLPGECTAVLKAVPSELAAPVEPGRRTHAESGADVEDPTND